MRRPAAPEARELPALNLFHGSIGTPEKYGIGPGGGVRNPLFSALTGARLQS
jgi:hypothetical protein